MATVNDDAVCSNPRGDEEEDRHLESRHVEEDEDRSAADELAHKMTSSEEWRRIIDEARSGQAPQAYSLRSRPVDRNETDPDRRFQYVAGCNWPRSRSTGPPPPSAPFAEPPHYPSTPHVTMAPPLDTPRHLPIIGQSFAEMQGMGGPRQAVVEDEGDRMIAALNNVVHALRSQSVSQSNSGVSDSIVGPKTFSGSAVDREAAENWLNYFQRYVSFRRFSPEASLRLFKMLLRDAASDWLMTLDPIILNSLDALVEQFKITYFKSPQLKWLELGKLFKETQRTDERFDDYLIRVRKTGLRLNMTEDMLHYAVINGLLPHIRTHVLSQGARTLDDTIKAARIAECSLTADPVTSLLMDSIKANKSIADRQHAAMAALTDQLQELTTQKRSEMEAEMMNVVDHNRPIVRGNDDRQRGNYSGGYRNQPQLTPFPQQRQQYQPKQTPQRLQRANHIRHEQRGNRFDRPDNRSRMNNDRQYNRNSSNQDVRQPLPCSRCGRRHGRDECPAQGVVCHRCQGVGHFSAVCRSARSN